MNRENLAKLAAYLERKVPQKNFDMAVYRGIKRKGKIEPELFKGEDDCGTVGCVLGWAPLVKGLAPIPTEYDRDDSALRFADYCERVFVVRPHSFVWGWLFASKWEYIDNTPEGASARIRYLLKHGKKHVKKKVRIWSNLGAERFAILYKKEVLGE